MYNSTRRAVAFVIMMATIFALSCDSENNNVVVPERPTDYFPMKKGTFQVYDVLETVYTLGVPARFTYQLKTTVVDSIYRADGSYIYVQYQYRRASSDNDWTYTSTWALEADERELIVNEANTTYLKYKFPLTQGYSWNGNVYNGLEEDEYVMEAAKVSLELGGINYPDCLVVNQNDNGDYVVYLDQRKEIYARGVGLVSKDLRQIHYCTETVSGCLGQQIVEEGVEYTQTLVSHGQE